MPKNSAAPAPWDNPGTPPTDVKQAEIATQTTGSTSTPGEGASALQTPNAGPAAGIATDSAQNELLVPAVASTDPEEQVTATVPKGFTLNMDHHARFEYKAGIQEMPLSHATHWWAKANGVQVYVKK